MVLARLNERTVFFVGLSLGIAISLILLPILEDRCSASTDRPRRYRNPALRLPLSDDYEPIINLQGNPEFIRQRESKNPQQLRPRYFSSELGIREKLLIGIISTQLTFRTHAGYLNRTISDEVKSVRFFVQVENENDDKELLKLPGVHVISKSKGDHHLSLAALRIIAQNYIKDYDFVFLAPDSTYIHVQKLLELVNSFSVSQPIHMGTKNNKSDVNSIVCPLNGGILLNQALIRVTATKLEECSTFQNEFISDISLSNCIYYASKVACETEFQDKTYVGHELPSIYLPNWYDIANSTTIYPILEGPQFLKLHEFVCQSHLENIYLEIENTNISGQWPLGLEPPFKPSNRFHVLQWNYFNQSHILSVDSEKPSAMFTGLPHYADLEDAIRSCQVWQVKQDGVPISIELQNGYMHVDLTRGVEYVLDFKTNISDTHKRFILFRPLSHSELLSVPYVTEHTRVIILLPITSKEALEAIFFLNKYEATCLEKQENTALVLILLYNATDPGKDSENDVFKEVKATSLTFANKYRSTGAKLVWFSIRTLREDLTEFAMLDLVIRKLPPQSLLLISHLGTTIDAEYLNRVRMNTISKYQVYFPIPFVQYNPTMTEVNLNDDFELKKHAGVFDQQDYGHGSFYISDYLAARSFVQTEVPVVRAERDLRQIIYYGNTQSLLKMFLKTESYHVLRAVEPQLKVAYKQPVCSLSSAKCLSTFKRTLGAKSHLAKVLLLEKLKKDKATSS